MRINSKTASEIYMIFFSHDCLLNKKYSNIFKSLFQEKARFYSAILNVLITKQSGYTQKKMNKVSEALDELSKFNVK